MHPSSDAIPAPPRRRRRGRIALVVVAALLLALIGAGVWGYRHLTGNLRVAPVGNVGAETTDASGQSPLNVLVIGSDARSSAADCKLGGDCDSTDVNGDVMLLVHVAADRSNATVMSIPRDTVTAIPACTDAKTGAAIPAHRDRINSSLEGGPACQVAAVHALTGIPVDHFATIDFAGVVTMSDAVGGVPVCVDANVYDTYSHLKLAEGTHTLVGPAALQFVRSRHAFGDGSDIGRTYAQHQFLSSMIRKLKSGGTLSDPVALFRLADAATKASTVDPGLGGIDKLVGLATDIGRVPTSRIAFTTMPTQPDPKDVNRLVPAPGAKALWASIIADRPLTKASPSPSRGSTAASATTSPTPTARPTMSAGGGRPQSADTRTCAKVSTFKTVEIDGVPMTPSRAYDVGTQKRIPDSAP